MQTIKINVNKHMDGYTFCLMPPFRELIKSWFPNAYPANTIFVAYDTNSNFEPYIKHLENYIYPALLGIEKQSDLNDKVSEILFIDSQTNKVLHKITE
jgi:hypothetical protein